MYWCAGDVFVEQTYSTTTRPAVRHQLFHWRTVCSRSYRLWAVFGLPSDGGRGRPWSIWSRWWRRRPVVDSQCYGLTYLLTPCHSQWQSRIKDLWTPYDACPPLGLKSEARVKICGTSSSKSWRDFGKCILNLMFCWAHFAVCTVNMQNICRLCLMKVPRRKVS